MKQMDIFSQLKTIFKGQHNIAITVHSNPDGDAIGSAFALCKVLIQLGHEATVLIPNMYPSFLSWMPQIETGVIFENQSKKAKDVLAVADYVFCLDYNSLKRSGALSDVIQKVTVPRVLIDHHVEPETDSFEYIYSDIKVSSTSEMIYILLKRLNLEHLIDNDVASCIYVGIMTDTGSFSYALKNPETFHIVASLVKVGIDAERIHRLIYDTFTENRLRLLGHSISNRMMVLNLFKTAIISLSLVDLNNFQYQIGDTEGLVNYPLSMEGINFSILITERKDQVRLSFRSKGSFSVNDFARVHFDGGGHYNAAGGNSSLGLKEVVSKLLKLLPEHAEQLNYVY
ncbi:MAG: DHH family phosphoesterase [Bacteroidetes bacterium HGW-Bacteroidetes-1]|jgi:phosphoesterase RecJ-like protein|nr:MAG: DHH family phosphoesterase [Bacteroidetes bacterium HGW-Bacteroidetes-1]